MNMIQRLAVKAFQLQGNSNPSGVSDYSDVPKSYPWDWWQKDMKLEDSFSNTTVEACVATISQTVAMLPVRHLKENGAGGFEEVKQGYVTFSIPEFIAKKYNSGFGFECQSFGEVGLGIVVFFKSRNVAEHFFLPIFPFVFWVVSIPIFAVVGEWAPPSSPTDIDIKS